MNEHKETVPARHLLPFKEPMTPGKVRMLSYEIDPVTGQRQLVVVKRELRPYFDVNAPLSPLPPEILSRFRPIAFKKCESDPKKLSSS